MTNPDHDRVQALLDALTLDEKLLLLGGQPASGEFERSGGVFGVERIGLPALRFGDGPVGVNWWTNASTCYPTLLCLAASMDESLAFAYGRALASDCRSAGIHVLLAPGVNLYRSPLCGRNFEYLGEDPELAGLLAAAYIRGVQSQGVAATVKHLAANNQEYDRHGISADVDERTLREVYLRPFELAITEGRSACVMTAYGLLNGQHCSENRWLLKTVLRDEWGFDGLVMSDWISVHSTVQTFNSGLDLEMPSARFFAAEAVRAALAQGLITDVELDEKIRHRLNVMARFGWLDPRHKQPDPAFPSCNPESEAVALEVARRGIVLLQNEGGLLPAPPASVRRIAVLGHHPGAPILCGGGSAYTPPHSSVTLAEAIRLVYGPDVEVSVHACIDPWRGEAVYPASVFTSPDGQPGLDARYFDNDTWQGAPALCRTERKIDMFFGDKQPEGLSGAALFSASWSGSIAVDWDGDTDFYFQAADGFLDVAVAGITVFGGLRGAGRSTLRLARGKHPVEVRFRQTQNGYVTIRFGYAATSLSRLDYEAGLAAARAADLVVVGAGFVSQTEGESHDREFAIDPLQVSLINDAAAVSDRVVAVLYAGGAVQTDPWLPKVRAVLCLWYPGQNGTLAAAEILAGITNPSGKLPFTWEKDLPDRGAHEFYHDTDGDRRVSYGDGVFVGYRHFDRLDISPRFAFGHGLSYTTFSYENLEIAVEASAAGRIEAIVIEFDLCNTGSVRGTECALIFVGDDEASVPRPLRELKATVPVTLNPGEKQTVQIRLDERALSFWHPDAGRWLSEPGGFTVWVGPSAICLPLCGRFQLAGVR